MTDENSTNRKESLEAAKAEAEIAKLLAEKSEIEKRVEEKWFTGRYLIQSVIAGLTVGALLMVWFKGNFEPILSAKEQVAVVEIELRRKENELDRVRNHIEHEKLRAQLSDLGKRNQELLVQQGVLQQLAERRLQDLKAGEKSTVQIMEEKKRIEAQLNELKKARAATQDTTNEIGRALKSGSITGYDYTSPVYTSPVCKTPKGVCALSILESVRSGQSCKCNLIGIGDVFGVAGVSGSASDVLFQGGK